MVSSNIEDRVERKFIYKRNGMNEIDCLIVDIDTAAAALAGGWELSPYVFRPEMERTVQEKMIVDQIAQDLNALLNLEFENSKRELADLAYRFLGVRIDRRLSVRNMRRRIREIGVETGKFDESAFNVLVDEEELVEHDG